MNARAFGLTLACLFAGGPAHAQVQAVVDSLFHVAMATLDSGDVAASVQAFQAVVKVDRKYAPAHEALTKLYLGMDTPVSRRRADQAAREAIRCDPDNLVYQLLLGEVMLFRGFRHNAGEHYDQVLARFPNAAEVAYWAGRNAVLEYMLTKNPHPVYQGRLQVFVQNIWDHAVLLLEKSIDLDSDNRDAYYQLGLAYLEHGDLDGLAQVAHRLLQRFPEEPDELMFLALAHQERGEFVRAGELYEAALVKMGPDERAMLENVDLIATDEDAPVLAGIDVASDTWVDSPAYRRFWIQRDPVLLTEANERRMEHYRRVAYANLRFSLPSRGEVGWQTVRGQTYIKFGHYTYRQVSHSLTFSEAWSYEGFTITFRSVNGLDKWGFAGEVGTSSAPDILGGGQIPSLMRMSPRLQAHGFSPEQFFRRPRHWFLTDRFPELSSDMIFWMRDREAFEKKPPRFVDPFAQQKYSLPHLVAAFREGDSVRVELAYAVPVEKLDRDGGVALDDGVFAFDAQWNEAYRQVDAVARSIAVLPDAAEGHLLRTRTLRMQPGAYFLVAEVGDRKGGSIGTFRQEHRWAVPDTGLAMSDLLLAERIRPRRGFPDGRADLEIVPNPLRTFLRGQSAFVYLELYNLAQNAFGRTRYDIAYRIGVPDKKEVDPALFGAVALKEAGGRLIVTEGEVVDALGGVSTELIVQYALPERNRLSEKLERLRRAGRQDETVIASAYAGDRPDEFTFLEIDLSQVPPGIYKLTVTATDVQTGQAADRSALFRVRE